jgi:hypothetical protein
LNLFHQRRRNRDPYAESFRERHALGINAVKRWAKRIFFVAALYGLYLLAIWLIFPWGEVTSTPTGPAEAPEFSIAAANAFIPNLLLSLIGPIFYFAFIIFIVVFQFVAIFWFLSRGRTYVIYPGEYDEEEKAKIATHEAGHAVASWYLEREELQMQVISIIKRENALGLVSYQEREDRYVRSRSDVMARIKTALAAGAAENVWFGETTTGVSQDLRQATWAAATMVGLFGMGKDLYSFGTIPNELAGGSSIGTLLRDGTVREEVNKILAGARKEIEDLLREKSTIVEGVRDALLEREEIIGEEIDRLFARLEARAEPQGSGVV